MKYLFCAAVVFLVGTPMAFTQKPASDFNKTVNRIKQNIECCSVEFEGPNAAKATCMYLFRGGEITIAYNNGSAPQSFNLYDLMKDQKSPLGIAYDSKFQTVIFHLIGGAQAIRFKTVSKAKETYDLFLQILKTDKDKNYRPQLPLTAKQTVDSINFILKQYNTDRAEVAILNDSVFKVSQQPSIRYNINVPDLKSSGNLKYLEVRGISLIPYMQDGFGKGARIVFASKKNQQSFMLLGRMPDDQLVLVHQLFIHLTDMMRKN